MEKKMRLFVKRYAAICAVFCLAGIFTGCKNGSDGMFGILTGVLAWSGQNWAESASSFLETLEKATEAEDKLLREYAVYGLASTYLAQDEYDSALARLSEIADTDSTEIRAGVWYQAGIIAFRRGEYDEAASFFRKSLENDPLSLDAKINLELSRLSLVERSTDRSSSSSGIREETVPSQETETIFNLIRKKEQDRWKNQEDKTVRPQVADY